MTSPKRIVKRNKARTYLEEDKPNFRLARKVFPVLVGQAKANGQPITYSDLAEEVSSHHRPMNDVLGKIGHAIDLLNKEKGGKEIPPIQGLAVNKKTGLPGGGFDGWYGLLNNKHLTSSEKHKIVRKKIANYKKWDWVLEQLGLEPITLNIDTLIAGAINIGFGRGESESHRLFKEAIAQRPGLIHLSVKPGEVEYKLPSGDQVDILFKDGNLLIGVEVKSFLSSKDDVLRGIFQCIKYKHVIEAKQKTQNLTSNSRIILALQGSLPSELTPVKNILGVEVIENIKI
jgi:hypothetical protein